MSDWPSLKQLSKKVNAGEIKAVDSVKKSLSVIANNQQYQAIIATTEDRALKRAAEIDQKISAGSSGGRLAGVPFIAKDNFLAFGAETTAASNILKGFVAPYQATAIERLEAEGAICVAKANLDAFAHGSSTENSDFFVTKNPHDVERVPGGSSGGSAAAVVLQMAPLALGTDTGGSVRLPASFCGAVGLKPTYGLISRSGVIAMASSTDVIGPLAMSVEDVALALDIMSGRDPLDSTTIDKDTESYIPQSSSFADLKIGLVKEYINEGVQPAVRDKILAAVEKIRQAGAQIEEISLPSLPLALAVYYIVCPAEVSSNLSRYDGQRFGYSDAGAKNLEDSYSSSREIGFGAEAKRRIMTGTYVLSSGYYDAYYKKAQTVRTKIINEFKQAFTRYDLLIGPTSPETAFKIGTRSKDPLKMYLTDIMTVAANIAGNPAISVPAGEVDGLPIGLQFIADMSSDRKMLAAAAAWEALK